MVELGPIAFAFLAIFSFIGLATFIAIIIAGILSAVKK